MDTTRTQSIGLCSKSTKGCNGTNQTKKLDGGTNSLGLCVIDMLSD